MSSVIAQVNQALGAPPNHDLYQTVTNVGQTKLIGGQNVNAEPLGSNTYKIAVDPVAITSDSSLLTATPSYYPGTNIVESYSLSMAPIPGVQTIVQGIPQNITITSPSYETIGLAGAAVTGGTGITVTEVTDPTTGTIKAYQVSTVAATVTAGNGINVLQLLDGSYQVSVRPDNSTITDSNGPVAFAANAITGSGGLSATQQLNGSYEVAPLDNLVTGINGVSVTSSGSGFQVEAKVDTTSVAIDTGGNLALASTAIQAGTAAAVSQATTGEFTVGVNTDGSSVTTNTSNQLALASTAVTSGVGSGITVTYTAASGVQTVATDITSANLTLTPSTTTHALDISAPSTTAVAITTDSYLNATGTASSGMTSYQVALASGASFIQAGAGIGINSGTSSFTILNTLPAFMPTNVLLVATGWSQTVPSTVFTTVGAAVTYANTNSTVAWQILVYPGTYTEVTGALALTNTSGCTLIGTDNQTTVSGLTGTETISNFALIQGITLNGSTTAGYTFASVPVLDTVQVICGSWAFSGAIATTIRDSQWTATTTGTNTTSTTIVATNTAFKVGGDLTFGPTTSSYFEACSFATSVSTKLIFRALTNVFSSTIGQNFSIIWGDATGPATGCIWDTPLIYNKMSTADTTGSSWCDQPVISGSVANVSGTNIAVNYPVPFNPSAFNLTWFVVVGLTAQAITGIDYQQFTFSSSTTVTVNYVITLPTITASSLINL